jgi:hypothetical protein
MKFKTLFENMVEEKDTYTLDELKNYRIWEANIAYLPLIKKYIKRKGFYNHGARVIVPVLHESNEVEAKAKEIIEQNTPTNLIGNIKKLRAWTKENVSVDRLRELRLNQSGPYDSPTRHNELSLYHAKNLIEMYSRGYLIIPIEITRLPKASQVGYHVSSIPNMNIEIGVHCKDMPNSSFEKINEGIAHFKNFSEYKTLDKETEQAWGNVLDEL